MLDFFKCHKTEEWAENEGCFSKRFTINCTMFFFFLTAGRFLPGFSVTGPAGFSTLPPNPNRSLGNSKISSACSAENSAESRTGNKEDANGADIGRPDGRLPAKCSHSF